jgi:hypothetical protein
MISGITKVCNAQAWLGVLGEASGRTSTSAGRHTNCPRALMKRKLPQPKEVDKPCDHFEIARKRRLFKRYFEYQ